MKNKLILFDWGNIVESNITGYTVKNAWDDLAYECGYKDDESIYFKFHKYKLSKIMSIEKLEDTYYNMKKEFNLNKSYEEFCLLYIKIFGKIDYFREVADFEVSLKDRCYVGILSNILILDKERLDRQVDLSRYDYVFLSFELGLRKPEKEIYEKVQSMVPFKKENILFIDDREDNIEAARNFGWKTLKATYLQFDEIKEVCNAFLEDNL